MITAEVQYPGEISINIIGFHTHTHTIPCTDLHVDLHASNTQWFISIMDAKSNEQTFCGRLHIF